LQYLAEHTNTEIAFFSLSVVKLFLKDT